MKTAELQRKIDELEAKCSSIQAEIKNLKSEAEKPELPTYDDVVEELQSKYYFNWDGRLCESGDSSGFLYATKEMSEREKLRCQWLNIAEYVNRKYEKREKGYWRSMYFRDDLNEVRFMLSKDVSSEDVRFRSLEAAKEALRIMGEDNYKKMIGV